MELGEKLLPKSSTVSRTLSLWLGVAVLLPRCHGAPLCARVVWLGDVALLAGVVPGGDFLGNDLVIDSCDD